MAQYEKREFHFEDEKHFSLYENIKTLLREGNVAELDELLTSSGYLHDIEHIFFNDTSLAIASFEYMWAQSSYVAIEEKVDAVEAGRLYEYYRHQLLSIDSIKEAMALNREFHISLCKMVDQVREKTSYSKLVRECRTYLREHILEPPTVQDAANALNVSRGHLSGQFKKETGQTVQEFIQALRLAEIVEFMENPSVPSSEIWQLTGFSSQSHYIQFFKKMTGETPYQFELHKGKDQEAEVIEMERAAFRDLTVTPETEEILDVLDDYAEKGGFKQQLYLLYCVRKGRPEDLNDEIGDPRMIQSLRDMFKGNRTMALETLLYLLPQISAAAVDGGVSMKSASRIYIDVIRETETADCDRLLDLLRESFIDYASLVQEVKRQSE